MYLTKKNINKWKKELDRKMLINHGIKGYSKTQTDKEWLENYLGKSEIDAISDEEECMLE